MKNSNKIKKALVVFIIIIFFGCKRNETKPIEKYNGFTCVIADYEQVYGGESCNLLLKNKDSIFWINALTIDAKNIKIGDSIR